jgi:hypothetical protein
VTYKLLETFYGETNLILENEVVSWLGGAFETAVRLQIEVSKEGQRDGVFYEDAWAAVLSVPCMSALSMG